MVSFDRIKKTKINSHLAALYKPRSQGFTLIELLVVIAIIGLLAAVVLVSLNSARAKSRDARRVSDMHQLNVAMELFYNSCGQYPSTLTTGANNGCSGVTLGSFLSSIPVNPAGCTVAGGATNAGSATAYGYSYNVPVNSYTMFFCTEGAVLPTLTGASSSHTASPSGLAQ
jgi:prepilin-type N-terminal cleavage/methylation domain-containing protein